MNRNCSACNIMIDENNYLNHKTVCKSCYNKNRRKNTLVEKEIDTTLQQPKIDNVNNKINVPIFGNRANVIIGPKNVGKTSYMLKVLEKIDSKRPIHVITRSPNQYPSYKTSVEIKPINKYKGSVVVFDDMLGARNSSQIDEFFARERHEDLEVYYISQSYFALPRQSIRKNSDR